MRMKEGSSDYRYFPDPDLDLIETEFKAQKKVLKEFPVSYLQVKRNKYVNQFGLSAYDASGNF